MIRSDLTSKMRIISYKKIRSAFTLIEILFVICIVGILIALLLPAVSSVRELSRKASCVNNLRQFGLALANYESVNGRFPPGTTLLQVSPHVMLLPYLEQATLYSQINLSIHIYFGAWDPPFKTVSSIRVSSFICPSDNDGMFFLKLNYSASAGWNKETSRTVGIFPRDGFGATTASVNDGLSNTITFSERLRSEIKTNGSTGRIRPTFLLPPDPRSASFESYLSSCRSIQPSEPPMKPVVKGVVWISGDRIATSHDHNDLPNTLTCWCQSNEGNHISVPASSLHSGLVNAAFADGHVSSIKTSLDLAVWRAISTRSGQEPQKLDY